MTIREDGNVGIGDSTPTFKLDVVGTGRYTADLYAENDVYIGGKLRHNGDVDNYLGFGTDIQSFVTGNSTRAQFSNTLVRFNQEGLNQDFQIFGENNDNLFYADASTDRIGIGTAAPDTNLHVFKATAGTITNYANNALVVENSGDVGISLLTPNANAGHLMFGSPGHQYHSYIRGGYGASTTSTLKFYTDGINTMTHKAGNVGIGTDTPAEKLHIFNSLQSWNQYANIRMSTESDSYAAEIGFHRGTSNDSDRGLFLSGDGSTKHVRVLHGGNVGIGNSGVASTRLAVTNSVVGVNIETTSSNTGHEALIVNRQNSDGIAIAINKAGSTIGSIGIQSSTLQIGTANTQLAFSDADDAFFVKNAAGTARDNSHDLGKSNARFKDLHLSGDANIEHLNTTNGLYDLVSSNPSGFAAGASADTWYEITDVDWNNFHTADHVHDHFCIGLFWTSGVTANGYNHRIRIYVPNFSSNVNNPYRPTPANGSFSSTHRDYDGSPSALIFASHHTGMNASGNFKFDARFTNQSTASGNLPLRLQVKTNTPPASGTSVTMKVWRL
jgi:hypothetical protein